MANENGQGKSTLVHNRIFIEEDKEFTLDEFAHLVARAVRSAASVDIDKDDVIYSRDDVYFTIVDVLGYINERTPGRFKFDQTSFQNYLVHYVPDGSQKRKAQKGLVVSKAQSALVIKGETGMLPVWAKNDQAILDAIADIEANQDSGPSIANNVLESREDTNTQIEAMAQEAVRCYRKTDLIPDTVTTNAAVLKRFQEIINTPQEATDV